VNHPAKKSIDDSTSDQATQEQPAGQSPIASDPPSPRNAVSPYPLPTPQIPSQGVDDKGDPISQENHGGSTGADKSKNERPDAIFKETLQRPRPDADDHRSGSDTVSPKNRDGSAGMDEGQNATSRASSREATQGPPSHTDYDRSGSNTNLQNTLGGGNMPRVDLSDKEPGELSVRKFVCVVAETSIVSDLNRGSDGGGEGIPGTFPFRPLLPEPYTGGDLALNAGNSYHQDGEDRDPSPTSLRPTTPPSPATSPKTMHLPRNPSTDHLGRDQSSASIPPISIGA